MTEPIDQAMYSKEEIKALYRSLLYGFKRCKKEKNLDECSFGYETGVLITGNDAKYLIELMNQQTVWAEKLKQERELRKELVDGFLKLFQMKLHIPSEHWVEWSEYHKQIESLIQKAKDKSHE